MSDSRTIPEYLPGDIATVEFMVKHETNIEELGAWFTRQLEEEEDEGEPEIFFLGSTEVVSREGAQILSQAILHHTITHQYLPGEYRLRAMTTFSESGSRNRRIRDVPDIRLRVLPEPKTVPEVVRWEVY